MGKVKTKKHDTFIDMTAMSDVTVLLLTFFMLTATFMPKEPVQVVTPSSVSETKIPENNVLTILVDGQGQVYLNLDKPEDKVKVLKNIDNQYGLKLTDAQYRSFENQTHIGVPISQLSGFLSRPLEEQDELLKKSTVPTDSILGPKNELAIWIKAAKTENKDLAIAIKSDQTTPYPAVKTVISTLQDLRENRFSLITSLRGMPDGL